MKTEVLKMKLADLTPTSKNPRQIKKEDLEKLKKSVKDAGWMLDIREIVVDENNRILGGHMRVKALMANGETMATVKRVSGLTEEQKDEFLIRDNVQNGEWDMDIAANEWDVAKLVEWGVDGDWAGETEDAEEDNYSEEDAEKVLTRVKSGEIWQLGEHRLMCGDSTDKGAVEKLMGGVKADMVFTDPPYGVGIKGKYTGKILNDELKNDELETFLSGANENMRKFCKGHIYVCYEVLNSTEFFKSFGRPDEVICFAKDSATFYSDNKYNRKFELILYYSNGKALNTHGETNVWEVPKSSSFNNKDENGKRFNDIGNFCVAHPTTKPLPIPSRAIRNSSSGGDLVLDLFGGSGSTLIACEQLGRRCYMMELDPHYCDVIIDRWEKFTGKEAVKL